MRVFAGPNGSGKTTIVNSIRTYKVNGVPVDFGIYINADDIYQELLEKGCIKFTAYETNTTKQEFIETALSSGLINDNFPRSVFLRSFSLADDVISLKTRKHGERLAQVIADFLRKDLLRKRKKFSFETVFSHKSKLAFMEDAYAVGYKIYLYFVATEDPAINIFRVNVRVQQGGHPVPEEKIVDRYYRSLDQLYDAAQLAYQCFFFDNSISDKLIAHFKLVGGIKKWDKIIRQEIPEWFIRYYSSKISSK